MGAEHTTNIWDMMIKAGPMVQFVLLLLLSFPITSWTIIVLKFRTLRKAFRESFQFTEFFWKSQGLAEAYSKSKVLTHSPIARVFRIAYVELNKINRFSNETSADDPLEKRRAEFRYMGLDNISRSLKRASNAEMTRLSQMVSFLATAGNTTPFIGLFGKVWGIMDSFHAIGERGSASLADVAPGISEALVATAAGLAVAIPSVIAFNYFMNKIRIMDSELQSFSADVLNIIERDILRQQGR